MFRSRLALIRSLLAALDGRDEDDPGTWELRLRLADAYGDNQYEDRDQQRWEDREFAQVERVVASRARILGADHPLTLDARHRALRDLDQKPDSEVRPLVAGIATGRERALGLSHPDTLDTLEQLRWWTPAPERADLDERITRGRERALTDRLGDDFEAMWARTRLAGWYDTAGRREDARRTLVEAVTAWTSVVAGRTERLGPLHPSAVEARERLAWLLNHRLVDGADGATRVMEELVADHERLLGPDDPRTLGARVRLARHYFSKIDPRATALAESLIGQVSDFEEIAFLRYVIAGHRLMAGRDAEALAAYQDYPVPSDADEDLRPGHPDYPDDL